MKIEGKLAFVGAGNMAAAMIKGMLHSGIIDAKRLWAGERRAGRCAELRQAYGIEAVEDNLEAIKGANVVILAVKPQIFGAVLPQIKDHLQNDALIISIAAGVSIDSIRKELNDDVRIIRTMPNVACTVGQGAAGLALGPNTTQEDEKIAKAIFESVGMAIVLSEEQLDAVTGLSGSGPAYVFMVIEALADAGVKVGLSRWDAHALACQTVMGAAQLVIESKEHPGRLKDMVCSPGGTAISAVHTLEQGGLRTTLINAVEVATNRSIELGQKDV